MAFNKWRSRLYTFPTKRQKKYLKSKKYRSNRIVYKSKRSKLGLATQYRFSRLGTKSSITISGTLEQSYAYSFNLQQISGFTDFATLFDQYKLTGVKVMFRLMSNPDAGSNNNTAQQIFPSIWTVTDHDDDNTITLAQMKEKQGARRRVLRPNSIVSSYIKSPHIDMSVYNSSVTTGYTSSTPRWLDMNSPNIPHYGLKIVLDSEGVSQIASYYISVEMKYYFKCKGVQ